MLGPSIQSLTADVVISLKIHCLIGQSCKVPIAVLISEMGATINTAKTDAFSWYLTRLCSSMNSAQRSSALVI
jgi:hypothetical protein